jgi:hypothetical protein
MLTSLRWPEKLSTFIGVGGPAGAPALVLALGFALVVPAQPTSASAAKATAPTMSARVDFLRVISLLCDVSLKPR